MHGFSWKSMLAREFGSDAVGYLCLDLQGASWDARLDEVCFHLVAERMDGLGRPLATG